MDRLCFTQGANHFLCCSGTKSWYFVYSITGHTLFTHWCVFCLKYMFLQIYCLCFGFTDRVDFNKNYPYFKRCYPRTFRCFRQFSCLWFMMMMIFFVFCDVEEKNVFLLFLEWVPPRPDMFLRWLPHIIDYCWIVVPWHHLYLGSNILTVAHCVLFCNEKLS